MVGHYPKFWLAIDPCLITGSEGDSRWFQGEITAKEGGGGGGRGGGVLLSHASYPTDVSRNPRLFFDCMFKLFEMVHFGVTEATV